MTVLTTAAVMALIINPACGNVSVSTDQGRDSAEHLRATVLRESGGDPFVIGINADLQRGLPAGKVTSRTSAEATARAHSLLAQGRRIDLGLFQISDAQLVHHHLTVETAFDQCQNTAAGAEHLADDFRVAAWTLAHRRYNCGRLDCGISYAASITRIPGPPVPAPPRSAPDSFLEDEPVTANLIGE